MNAFDDGRVGLWVNSAANFTPQRLSNAAAFADGMFTDIFLPRTAPLSLFDTVRKTYRPNGTMLKAQMWTDPHDLDVATFAEQTFQDIVAKKPGVVELDIEPNGSNRTEAAGKYASYMTATVTYLRGKASWMQNFPLGLNIPPYKAEFLPRAFFQSDPFLYAREQVYYGDMSRVSEGEALGDLLGAGVPETKASLCYGVVAPDKDGVRRLTLPTVFYQGKPVRKLRRGLVFTDDLMAEQGLI